MPARVTLFDAGSAAVLLALFGEPLDRDHALALGGVEHDHALGGAAGDADAVDRTADQLTAIGDQHDLVALLDRERGDDAAVALGHVHRDDAFAAAAGGAVLVGRAALAEAVLRDGEHELLGSRQVGVTLLAELDRSRRLLGVAGRLLFVAVAAAAHRGGTLEIGGPLVGRRLDVAQDRQPDHPVAVLERDAAHAHRGAALED